MQRIVKFNPLAPDRIAERRVASAGLRFCRSMSVPQQPLPRSNAHECAQPLRHSARIIFVIAAATIFSPPTTPRSGADRNRRLEPVIVSAQVSGRLQKLLVDEGTLRQSRRSDRRTHLQDSRRRKPPQPPQLVCKISAEMHHTEESTSVLFE